MTSTELKAFHNTTVSILFCDGEIATARLTCAGADCEEVMVDILGTNRSNRYTELDACSYVVPVSEIVSVIEISVSAAYLEARLRRDSVIPAQPVTEIPSLLEVSPTDLKGV